MSSEHSSGAWSDDGGDDHTFGAGGTLLLRQPHPTTLHLHWALATCLRTSEFLNRPLRPSSRSGCWLAGGQAGAGPGAAGGGGARDGVEPAGLLARVRGVLAVQPRHGQLQVLRGRAAAVPHGLPLHVQGQVLPGALQLADRRDEATASGQRTKYELSRGGE